MTRRARIHAQRFTAMCNVGLAECERKAHSMRPVAAWPQALAGTRMRWKCEHCSRLLTVDISGATGNPSRYGSALDYNCKGDVT